VTLGVRQPKSTVPVNGFDSHSRKVQVGIGAVDRRIRFSSGQGLARNLPQFTLLLRQPPRHGRNEFARMLESKG
jgi:hypothetical protein